MAKISINLKEGKLNKQEDLIIGIDLGTTNSLVAYVKDGDSEAYAIKDKNGTNTLVPSIIHFNEEGKILVGEAAKKQLEYAPARTIYSVKRLMGKSFNDLSKITDLLAYRIIDEDDDSLVKIEIDGKYHSPISLSAEILKYLKLRIEDNLQQEVQKAVITVPAYFNDAQRQATRDAGKLAGLDVLRIVNEPTAAALAYGIGLAQEDERTVVVYDLGGGTFDISILDIKQGIFEVIATNGDTFLGGDDFDRTIIDYWIEKYALDIHEISTNKTKAQSLRLAAEKAKKTLSSQSHFEIKLDGINLELTIETYNSLIKSIVDKTIACCGQAMKDAGLTPKDIDEVIMVGGSTRVPLVRQEVKRYFDKELNLSLNPDEVVALGAAVQASVLAGKQKGVLLLDITPLSLGIETVGGLMDVIISRNSKIPTSLARQYTTSIDGQKNLKISVYQGERDLVQYNRKLGEFILSNIPPMPAGIPKIEVQFLLDADGILVVKAKELRSGKEQEIVIQSQYGISEEEMGKMLLDSIKNAQSDMTIKALLEARNEANNIIVNTERFLKQNNHWLGTENIEQISQFLQALKDVTQKDDKDAINQAITEINDFTAPLAHQAMDKAMAESLGGKGIDEID